MCAADATVLECASSCSSSFATNGDFNSAAFQSDTGRLSFSITGTRDSTPSSATTGSAILLVRVQLQFRSSATVGVYGSTSLSLYPRAETLANTGGYAFVSTTRGTQRGVVYDARDSANSYGQLELAVPVSRGIFAHMLAPVLVSATLGGAASYSPVVNAVTSDSRYSDAGASPVTPTACALDGPDGFDAPGVVTLSGCALSVGEPSQSVANVVLNVTYVAAGATLRAIAHFDVFSAGPITISSSDATLNRIADAAGASLSACSSGSTTRYPYQSTRLSATASASLPQSAQPLTVDISNLVGFSVDAPSIATIGSGEDWNVLFGRSVGSATVRLAAHTAATPGAPNHVVAVSDAPVYALSMASRVVTGVAWSATPPYWYTYGTSLSAEVLVSQTLAAEGDTGLLYSVVSWSDGAV